MRVLNLYAGVGGNRKLWENVDVTAVELNPDIAAVYADLYPCDEVVIGNAHDYLLEHHTKYDFIWTSPPCQTHSQIRYNIGFKANRIYEKVKPAYPAMQLYQEIILLQHYYDGLWVVENTIPYYEPLIPGQKKGGHIWWANFGITKIKHGNRNHRGGTVKTLSDRKQINLDKYDIQNKRQILRNCVEPEVGLHVLNCALAKANPEKAEQGDLFLMIEDKYDRKREE